MCRSQLAIHRWGCLAGSLLVGLLAAGALRGEESAAKIPLKRVVMFSSGVAFFDRSGPVEGDASVELKFNTRDINDLLKSMVLQDQGGGKISTISYDSKVPISHTLQTFSIDLASNPTLADLLDQIRGERVEVMAPTAITGTIVGVEKRQKQVGEDRTVEIAILNLLTDDGLRSVPLDSVGRIKILNPKLEAEFLKALEVLASAKSTDKKGVTLNFTGKGKREVRVGYIQQSPIWKTSYRLVLSDEKPLLQGWAIVENTTEEDWDGINLTLISGRPISFVMDLYQPLFVERPEVQPELYASLKPRTYDQDLAGAERDFQMAGEALRAPAPTEALAKGAAEFRRKAMAANEPLEKAKAIGGPAYLSERKLVAGARMNPKSSIASAAQAADVGELFQYRIATPVSLQRQKSAMLPIVNDSVEGEKVSIYNQAVQAKHPLNGLRLKNTTDLFLMQGPITVFDEGAYAGDAQIQDLPPGSERLISYALDLDVEVAPQSKPQPDHLLSVKLIRGTLETSRKYVRQTEYTLKNSGQKARKVLIEYPIDAAWKLVTPKEPTEKTRELYRFAVSAEPGKPATETVREEQVIRQQYALSNLDHNTIVFYLNQPVVSEQVKAALAEVIQRKQQLAALTARRAEIERQVKVIFDEQGRIRQNMGQLPKDSDLYRRYVTKFNEQEDSVEKLRSELQQAIASETKSRESLNTFLQNLDLS